MVAAHDRSATVDRRIGPTDQGHLRLLREVVVVFSFITVVLSLLLEVLVLLNPTSVVLDKALHNFILISDSAF